jgi:hypothetical protein
MKKYLLVLIAMLISTFASCNDYKEGDVVFIISQSSQSKFIAYATRSMWTHCGIVVYKNNKPYVLEASNVVKLTSLDNFKNKGKGGALVQYRYTENSVKINYQKYLGIPYDSQFSLTNGRYYCSELVWKIYKDQLGVKLCDPKPLSDYNTFGLKWLLKKRKISNKSKFVAPSDLYRSPKLYKIQ